MADCCVALKTKSKEMHFKDEIFGVFFNYYLYFSALWAPPTHQSDHQQLMQRQHRGEQQETSSGAKLGIN